MSLNSALLYFGSIVYNSAVKFLWIGQQENSLTRFSITIKREIVIKDRGLTLRREVGDGVEDLCTAVEAAHGGVANHALEDQLRAVRSDRT